MTYFSFDCQSDYEMSYQVSLIYTGMQYVADKHTLHIIRETETHNVM